ncbi:hypothetical protein WICANDRAFT_80623 [Wickerhamomyces anomalus NRRL Y-366-8]|uniref:Uncharacterized protein n=1 Tax=Wickerhamomyces anomalus (strain ATCC 58044 / CBS 1984 / NCYC 433 / NRRL Y-366-8) TaxID=683960 RepID=A0A1E3NZK4_WICAA|nr:uncharacterized protein WICANDRAFT_80623 [Wickerhamomyces anomalus NRRL Y-366-8]ODQ58488.1 hypothetical protein WICANDRAFT_80623 [Wickerhamomyces anomalus NRRL Y-366-8]
MAKSMIVTLNVPSESLRKFPAADFTPKKRRKSSTSNAHPSTNIATPTPVKKESSLNTPIPNSRGSTPSALEDGRRRARGGRGGAKGSKRSLLSSPAPEGSIKQETPSTAPATSSTSSTNHPTVKSTLSKSVGTGGGSSGANGDDDKLDKSGAPVRKWTKKPIDIISFTGYNIEFKSWTGAAKGKEDKVVKPKDEEGEKDVNKGSFKVQIKLNNKALDVDEDNAGGDSRDQSPALMDDASSIVTTPEGSNAMTPVP